MGGRGAIGETRKAPKLPKLTGSEKQIAWAEDIRRKVLNDVNWLAEAYNVQLKRWQSTRHPENAPQMAERDVGYSLKDVNALRKEVYKTLSDDRAKSAKLIIDRLKDMDYERLRKMAQAYSRQRKK